MKIIIVDDEKITRDGLSDSVCWSEFGIDHVYLCEDGREAMELALQINPEIILSDIRMPVMDGIELATKVQKLLPQCKFIFLSGYSDKEYLKSAIQLKAVDYVEKPINTDELTNAIKSAVALYREESENLKQKSELNYKLQKSIPLMKEKLAQELLSAQSNIDLFQNLYDFKELGIDVDGIYITLLIKITFSETIGPERNQSFKICISNALEEYMSNNDMSYMLCFKDENTLVAHISSNKLQNVIYLKEILESISNFSSDLLQDNGKVFIGAGKQVSGIKNIHKSYRTAAIALQKEFFMDYNRFAIYKADDSSPVPYTLNDNTIEQFENLLRKDRQMEAVIVIKRLSNELRNYEGLLVAQAKSVYTRMAVSLAAIADERNISISSISDIKSHLFDVVSRASSLKEIETHFIDFIHLIFIQFHEKQNKSTAVYNAIKYIQQYYNKDDLSLEEIANHIGLTSTHLCHVFKKETGKTLNKFITETRIKKAKELLKDNQVKLYEVSENVGYTDPNYFAKVFKKYTGLSPTDFREKYLL